jgi:hypothetical protein
VSAEDVRRTVAAGRSVPPRVNGQEELPPADDWSDAPLPPFVRVDLSAFSFEAEPAPQPWPWDGLVPPGNVTVLGGHGGAGKSVIGLMFGACSTVGRECLGRATQAANVCFFSGEDPADMVRRRLTRIIHRLELAPADVLRRLHVLDATDGDPALYAENRVRDQVIAGTVRAFMRALVRLVRARGGAVLLLVHVDKSTARGMSSESYSGSTAWHNSARSRLFLKQEKPGELDLTHEKCNLGPRVPPMRLEWPTDGLPELPKPLSPVVHNIQIRNDTRAILGLLHEFTGRGEFVSTAPTSRTNAPALMRGASGFPANLQPGEVFNLLRDAERAGLIVRLAYKGTDRKARERWDLTPAGLSLIGAASAATKSPQESPQQAEVTAKACGDCGDSAAGGCGGRERAQEAAA